MNLFCGWLGKGRIGLSSFSRLEDQVSPQRTMEACKVREMRDCSLSGGTHNCTVHKLNQLLTRMGAYVGQR